mmetsp:Transcript_6193/g.11186  ORF Transcript_6193/g.11186 Transcript_6193/m.11186 type:complete len:216 (+) Transcript_6193:393-1040(+)
MYSHFQYWEPLRACSSLRGVASGFSDERGSYLTAHSAPINEAGAGARPVSKGSWDASPRGHFICGLLYYGGRTARACYPDWRGTTRDIPGWPCAGVATGVPELHHGSRPCRRHSRRASSSGERRVNIVVILVPGALERRPPRGGAATCGGSLSMRCPHIERVPLAARPRKIPGARSTRTAGCDTAGPRGGGVVASGPRPLPAFAFGSGAAGSGEI